MTDREALIAFMRRVNPILHEPLATKVAEEWVDKFVEEFEQAHTPTDDERELIEELRRCARDSATGSHTSNSPLLRGADLATRSADALARRAVQGSGNSAQNSDDEWADWTATLEALLAEVYTILKPLAEKGTHGTSSPILKAYALLNAQEFTRRTVQGEPTDAECVEIANRAQAVTGRSIWPSTVREVLRAAAATQEGETR